ARIVGIDLPKDKRIEVALTYIYGIGLSSSKRILSMTKVSPDSRVRNLTEEEVTKLKNVIEKEFKVEGDLRREITQNIKLAMDIGRYAGLRHRRRLPVHGQRTHTNARTRKGPRGTAITKKKAPGKK
ncbi:30S ribosomal protein S13, partial [bacterium]|nr:30S ribosomal protein S13 [bacterium]